MNYYITTFYNIRYLQPYQIPVSTAMWDPKYYHDNKGSNYCFVDSNGIMNGIREESLSPKFLPKESHVCQKGCPYRDLNPECPFLLSYQNYLSTVEFGALNKELERTAKEVQMVLKFTEEPEIVLLVYETENNPCSERVPLINYFKNNGVELKTWKRRV